MSGLSVLLMLALFQGAHPKNPVDVPPIQEEYGNLGYQSCDQGCWWVDVEKGEAPLGIKLHRRTHTTCADKARFLMTAEDGSKHCIAFSDPK